MIQGKHEISSELIKKVKENSIVVTCKPGEVVFKQNSPFQYIYYIDAGLVKIYKETKNHREIIISVIGPGNFLGIATLWDNKINSFNTVAIEETKLYLMEETTFRNLITSRTENTDFILNLISFQSLEIINRLITINQKQLPGRIADLILYFYRLYDENLTFSFPLTRKELAQLAGTTKESLIRTLIEFKNDRIIELSDREVKINSMEIVKTLSRLG